MKQRYFKIVTMKTILSMFSLLIPAKHVVTAEVADEHVIMKDNEVPAFENHSEVTIRQDAVRVNGTYFYDYAYEVLAYINIERAKVSARPLVMDRDLLEAGMLRALESQLFFNAAHQRPDGTMFGTVSPKVQNENMYMDHAFITDAKHVVDGCVLQAIVSIC